MVKKRCGKGKRRAPKTVLRLPDLDQAKSAVLNNQFNRCSHAFDVAATNMRVLILTCGPRVEGPCSHPCLYKNSCRRSHCHPTCSHPGPCRHSGLCNRAWQVSLSWASRPERAERNLQPNLWSLFREQ